MKGAIVLQTSKDRKNWVDVKCITKEFWEYLGKVVLADGGV